MPYVPTVGGTIPYLFQPSDCTFSQALNADFLQANALTAYTPVVTSQTGTLGSVSATGDFISFGKICLGTAVVTFNPGTASGILFVSLPETAAVTFIAVGRETNSAGVSLTGSQSGSTLAILQYNNSPVFSLGATLQTIMTYIYTTT